MERLYILKLFSLCWAIACLATSDNLALNATQEVIFATMGIFIERTHMGQTAETALEFLDLLAA